MKKIAIEDWCNETIKTLSIFLSYWNENHGKDPEGYPIKMTEEEFYLKFGTFLMENRHRES